MSKMCCKITDEYSTALDIKGCPNTGVCEKNDRRGIEQLIVICVPTRVLRPK